jgi:hypothetical protein
MNALTMDESACRENEYSDMPFRLANFEEIIETNDGQTAIGDEEAFRLELGPTNCAACEASLTED